MQLVTQRVITDEQVDRIGNLPQVSTSIKSLVAQEATPAVVKITGVKVTGQYEVLYGCGNVRK